MLGIASARHAEASPRGARVALIGEQKRFEWQAVGMGMEQSGRIVLKSSQSGNISPEDGISLGRALAMEHRRVVVARDPMRSSSMMAEAVVSGLLSQGADVIDLGVVSAPVAARQSHLWECTVYVAARPGMISGYYLMNPGGGLFRDGQVRHLEILLQNPAEPPGHEGLGCYYVRDGATDEYNDAVSAMFKGDAKCTAVVDCRCGAASSSLPQILNRLGADIVTVNAQWDEDFRQPVAEDDPLSGLKEMVRNIPGSIGVRTNPIGTAVEVVDEHGDTVPMDRVFALLVLYLRPSAIAIAADAPSVIEDAFMGRVGSGVTTPYPEPQERRTVMTQDSAAEICDAVAAGAEMGYYHGSIVFGGSAAIGDGIRAAAAIVQMAGDNSLHAITDTLPEYIRDSREYECQMRADTFKRAVEECLGPMADRCTQYGPEFRVVLDGGWFLIRHRQDGEEARIEALAESQDMAYVIGLMEMADDLVRKVLRVERSSVDDLEVHRLPVRVVGAPAGPVVGLARYEVDAACVPEEVLVGLRGLVGVPRVGVGGAGQAVVYGRHPLVEEAVGVPVHRAREEDHLGDYPVYLARHAQELVGIGRPGGLVERVDEVHVHPADPRHREFTSLFLTLE